MEDVLSRKQRPRRPVHQYPGALSFGVREERAVGAPAPVRSIRNPYGARPVLPCQGTLERARRPPRFVFARHQFLAHHFFPHRLPRHYGAASCGVGILFFPQSGQDARRAYFNIFRARRRSNIRPWILYLYRLPRDAAPRAFYAHVLLAGIRGGNMAKTISTFYSLLSTFCVLGRASHRPLLPLAPCRLFWPHRRTLYLQLRSEEHTSE